MSSTDLATRCPACKTVFRVVPDQLKVSAGWVRCGRCAEVFNAHEALVEAAVVTTQAMPDELRGGPVSSFPPTELAGDTQAPADEASPTSTHARAPGAFFSDPHPVGSPPRFGSTTGGTSHRADSPIEIEGQAAHADEADRGSSWAFGPLNPPIETGSPAADPASAAAAAAADADAAESLITRRGGRKGLSLFERAAANDSFVPQTAPAPLAGHEPSLPPASASASSRFAAPPVAAENRVGPDVGVAPTATPEPPLALPDAPEAAPTPAATPKTARTSKKSKRSAHNPDSAPAPAALEPVAPVAPVPSFVHRANRAARWQSTPVRLGLLVGCGMAVAALAAQAGYQYRHDLAARWPAAKPGLHRACAALGCEIHAARSIEGLVIESIDLSRLDKSADLHGLTVSIRNQRRYEVALPALELSLTDPQGRLVARKVLLPQDLGVSNKAAVAAQGEVTLQGTLSLALGPVAGYTIVAFYP